MFKGENRELLYIAGGLTVLMAVIIAMIGLLMAVSIPIRMEAKRDLWHGKEIRGELKRTWYIGENQGDRTVYRIELNSDETDAVAGHFLIE